MTMLPPPVVRLPSGYVVLLVPASTVMECCGCRADGEIGQMRVREYGRKGGRGHCGNGYGFLIGLAGVDQQCGATKCKTPWSRVLPTAPTS